MDKISLKKLIAKNMTKSALDFISSIASQNDNNEIINLIAITEARYNSLIIKSLKDTADEDEIKKDLNRINAAVLEIIDMLSDEDFIFELPKTKQQVFKQNSTQFIDIFPRQDDICDKDFYKKVNSYLLKAESSIYVTGGGISQACDDSVMEDYLMPYRTLLDKGEKSRLFRFQYLNNLTYKDSGGIWRKSRWSSHLEQFIKEYKHHEGLHLFVAGKIIFPLHCFVVDYLKEHCVVEFFLPAPEGNGGNAIFLHGNLEYKQHIARDLVGSLRAQMASMQKIDSPESFSQYVESIIELKNR